MRSDAFARKRTHRQYPNAAIKIHEFPASSMMALRKALQQFSLESPVSSALTWLSRLFWPVMSMPCRSSRPPYPLPTLWGIFGWGYSPSLSCRRTMFSGTFPVWRRTRMRRIFRHSRAASKSKRGNIARQSPSSCFKPFAHLLCQCITRERFGEKRSSFL